MNKITIRTKLNNGWDHKTIYETESIKGKTILVYNNDADGDWDILGAAHLDQELYTWQHRIAEQIEGFLYKIDIIRLKISIKLRLWRN